MLTLFIVLTGIFAIVAILFIDWYVHANKELNYMREEYQKLLDWHYDEMEAISK